MESASGGPALLASLGRRLRFFSVDAAACALFEHPQVVVLPANVQYGCPEASGRFLYVVSSNGGPGVAGTAHYLSAFRIDWRAGLLRPHGSDVPLRQRPIHVTTDHDSAHVLVAYNEPSNVTVHAIAADGTIGGEVAQPHSLDTGVFAHQVCINRSGETAILVTRGTDPRPEAPEEPGALKVFDYNRGVLSNRASIAPGMGFGFGPRNVEFSPAETWLYASLERQNRLEVFGVRGTSIEAEPAFRCDALGDPENVRPLQMVGEVHVHPNGRYVYLANRAFGTTNDGREAVFAGGENSIVVLAIEERSGEPQVIQRVDTQGIYPRTFSIDPDGQVLVVANSTALPIRHGGEVKMRFPNLAVFAIGTDGSLTCRRTYEFGDTQEKVFWSGMVSPLGERPAAATGERGPMS